MKQRHQATGFTLIELMTAVFIAAILVAIAYPSYQDHVRKGKRAEGRAALLRAAQVLERYYSDRSTYVTDLGPLFGLAANATVYSGENPADDKRSAYTISAAVGACGDLAACYTLTATPVAPAATPSAIGFVDPDCGNLTLTSVGTRGWQTSADPTKAAKCTW